MKLPGLLAVVVMGLIEVGCASSAPRSRQDASPIYNRCINDRGEGSTRPIIFLFCSEAP
jgi:hypothetical protein